MTDFAELRADMVEVDLAARGIRDPAVLEAFRTVPREAFVPEEIAALAYEDSALPIEEEQTISQPYIVAVTVEALRLRAGDRVLEVGAGSGYAAAILGRVAKEVLAIERLEPLVVSARERLERLGYDNVHVVLGDGSLGLPDKAPFDAITVAAAAPRIPEALLAQLAVGGRLVVPVGEEGSQTMLRVVRVSESEYREERLAAVQFVPLIGEQGWEEEPRLVTPRAHVAPPHALATLVREVAEPLDDIDSAALDALLERVGDARVVLLGEATHGTSEFYRMRSRITKELITKRGFAFVAVEADWPDASLIDDHVRGRPRSTHAFTPFSRFPSWMWRNEEVDAFVSWLRAHNQDQPDLTRRVGFHGLDLYSLFTSIAAVLRYLDDVDPDAARVARQRYGTLSPFQRDPTTYGAAVLAGRQESSEPVVVATLREMLARRLDYVSKDGERFFDAAQNARVVANAERYYRAMYHGSAASWNLRDMHMFDTLQSLLAFHGPDSRGVVWAHNSHVGNAAATEMSVRGELNIGQLCRATLGERAYVIGFGTDHGTVAAASDWGAPVQTMRVTPSEVDSYERCFHESNVAACLVHLRDPVREAVREELSPARLERAIGVVYRPDTELASHYFYATLPQQFDEYVWFDETRAVRPLPSPARRAARDLPETYPFGP